MDDYVCPNRLGRALQQRIYMVGSDLADDARTFTILGTTDTYTVTLTREWAECTCPDHQQRGQACKHIIFVLVRVHHVEASSSLASMLARAWATAVPAPPTEPPSSPGAPPGRPEVALNFAADDECPICLEGLADPASLVWCRHGCGKCFHPDCAAKWAALNPTCVLCRAPWHAPLA